MIVAGPALRGRDSPPERRGIRGALRCPGDETEDGLTTEGACGPPERRRTDETTTVRGEAIL